MQNQAATWDDDSFNGENNIPRGRGPRLEISSRGLIDWNRFRGECGRCSDAQRV